MTEREELPGRDEAPEFDFGEEFARESEVEVPGEEVVETDLSSVEDALPAAGDAPSVEPEERRPETLSAEPQLELQSPVAEPSRGAPGWTHQRALVSGIHLHFVQQGEGPLVLLLHGFPEFWYGWRHQISRIAEAGFHVVAPDMRGYNDSDKPRAVAAYRLEILADDVAGLVRYFGVRKAHVIGHDWGGVIAQAFAVRHPQLLDRLVVLNAPHPGTYAREIRRLRQLRRSWYALAFQLPWLPEKMIRARDHALVHRVFTHDLPPGTFTDADIERYIEALEKPGALTSMINYYRASVRGGIAQVERWARPIEARTLFIWGERDKYLVPELLNGLTEWMPRLRIERFKDASHWVHHEEPERVGTTIVEFLKSRTG